MDDTIGFFGRSFFRLPRLRPARLSCPACLACLACLACPACLPPLPRLPCLPACLPCLARCGGGFGFAVVLLWAGALSCGAFTVDLLLHCFF